jgi:hypothetical protein
MKFRMLLLCALSAGLAATAQGQTQGQAGSAYTQTCETADLVLLNINSTSGIGTFDCTTNATVNGVAITGLRYSAYTQLGATQNNTWGVIVGTLANGGQVYFAYHTLRTVRNGVVGDGSLVYQIVSGTGTAAGIKGSGTCKMTGNTAQRPCVGTYTIP